MSEMRCPWCDKPRATHEDWDQYGGGEGTHLCWADPRCEMDGDENVVLSLRAALAAAQQYNAEARERIALDNAVCLCGCAAKDHEDLGEDGEQCENEDHECLRVAPAVLAAMQRLRASNAALREALEAIAHPKCECGMPQVPGSHEMFCPAISEQAFIARRALARAAEGEGKNNGIA